MQYGGVVVNARDDRRFDKHNHFITSDVNSSFLRRNGIRGTVKDFKQRLKYCPCAFVAETGNAFYHSYQHVKVFDVRTFS